MRAYYFKFRKGHLRDCNSYEKYTVARIVNAT